MPDLVADLGSNAEENIHHAASIIGRSAARRAVFDAVYTGKQKIKLCGAAATSTGLSEKAVYKAGKALVDNNVLTPTKVSHRITT